jgi:hypothetical protein
MSKRTKNNTLNDESEKRINMRYLPQWNDDNMPSLNDNNPTEEHSPLWPDRPPLDANQIDDFDSYVGVQVIGKNGEIIGERMEYRKKRKNK